jgi:CheY-like chemotaxis protein
MVKLLAELHGGEVGVESSVGEGSCFTVWLPVRAPIPVAVTEWALAATQSLVAAHSSRPPAEGRRTALIVEDDSKSAELVRVQLEAAGFAVLHADSTEAALSLASKLLATGKALSLITLDILLPNLDGWEFLSRIKQVPVLSCVPVVIISILAERNKGFALGAAAILQKPLSRQELCNVLTDLGLLSPTEDRALKVVVVDDDPKAVDLMAVCLRDLSCTVLCAYGGQEGIDLAQKELPDLIVLDLMMPEMNGFEVAEKLSKDSKTARIPILVVTAMEITTNDRTRLSA